MLESEEGENVSSCTKKQDVHVHDSDFDILRDGYVLGVNVKSLSCKKGIALGSNAFEANPIL